MTDTYATPRFFFLLFFLREPTNTSLSLSPTPCVLFYDLIGNDNLPVHRYKYPFSFAQDSKKQRWRKKAIYRILSFPSFDYFFLSFSVARPRRVLRGRTYVRRRNIIPDRDRRESERSTRFIWRSFALSLTHEPSREPAGFYPLLHALLQHAGHDHRLGNLWTCDKLLYYSSFVCRLKKRRKERERERESVGLISIL